MPGTSRPTGNPGRAKGSMLTPARFYHLSGTVLEAAATFFVRPTSKCSVSKTPCDGVRSTVRPARVGETGQRAARSSQGSRSHRLPRRSRSDGPHPASGRRQVHPRRGGSVHFSATWHRARRERVRRCAGGEALRARTAAAPLAYRSARRRASPSRMDRHRTLSGRAGKH